MALPSIEELMSMEISEFSGELLPLGNYNGVITDVEVRTGPKGPYLAIEVTIHDEDYLGRKVWRNSSFSEKAIGMPGGIAQLVQSTKPQLPKGLRPEDLPQALAEAVASSPIGIEVGYEERKKNNKTVIDPVSGEVKLRETIENFFQPGDDFVAGVEKEVAGVDSDLPF